MNEPGLNRILVIDDHREHLDYLATLLRRAGYEVAAFSSAAAAMDTIKRRWASLVITDVFMPEMDGFEVLRFLQCDAPPVPLIAISGTGLAESPFFLDCMRSLGAVAAFSKPIEADMLLATLAGLFATLRKVSKHSRVADVVAESSNDGEGRSGEASGYNSPERRTTESETPIRR
jgi:CheY-like chemotaxis protein